MKSKLAVAGFILSISPLLLALLSLLVFEPLKLFRGESAIGLLLALSIYFIAPALGFIFGIVSFVKIKNNPRLDGKILAITSIVIPFVLLLLLIVIG